MDNYYFVHGMLFYFLPMRKKAVRLFLLLLTPVIFFLIIKYVLIFIFVL
jgi:hypothetical protein